MVGPASRQKPSPSDTFRLLTATASATAPPGLAEVVAAWPDLPEAIRAGILAMIRSASAKGGGS